MAPHKPIVQETHNLQYSPITKSMKGPRKIRKGARQRTGRQSGRAPVGPCGPCARAHVWRLGVKRQQTRGNTETDAGEYRKKPKGNTDTDAREYGKLRGNQRKKGNGRKNSSIVFVRKTQKK